MLWVGIDVGGTFIDAVAYDQAKCTFAFAKAPSTPDTRAVLDVLTAIKLDLGSVERLVQWHFRPFTLEHSLGAARDPALGHRGHWRSRERGELRETSVRGGDHAESRTLYRHTVSAWHQGCGGA
jgi:hypothetical protein